MFQVSFFSSNFIDAIAYTSTMQGQKIKRMGCKYVGRIKNSGAFQGHSNFISVYMVIGQFYGTMLN